MPDHTKALMAVDSRLSKIDQYKPDYIRPNIGAGKRGGGGGGGGGIVSDFFSFSLSFFSFCGMHGCVLRCVLLLLVLVLCVCVCVSTHARTHARTHTNTHTQVQR